MTQPETAGHTLCAGSETPQADGGCSRRGAGGRVFAEEQEIGDILSGQAFRGRYPLYQIGERPGEIDHKILKPLGTPKRGYSGDYLANSNLADLRVVIV